MELTDFMAQYPSIDDENIQTKISAKWEFASLASTPSDVTPGPSGFFKHQDLIERLMRAYKRQILIHETGTGKSYLIGDVGEYARREYHGRGIRGVIVVVKGKPQMIDIIKTLVCKSTHGHYLTESVKGGTTERGMKSAASRSLKKWYDVRTYGTFAKYIASMDDASLRARFSDYFIIFDEFHNTRILDDQVSIHQSEPLTPGQNVTLQMWRLSHVPLRIKVIGLSASLIINDVNEAIGTLNLILPIDRQIPEKQDGRKTNLRTMSLDELAKYTNGYVSFVSSPDVHVYAWRQGKLFNQTLTGAHGDTYQSQLILYPLGMSEYQANVYVRAFKRDMKTKEDDKENKVGKSGFRINARQASKGVYPPSENYPNGSWGNEGFKEHFQKTKDGWYTADKQMKKYYKDDRLGELSVSALQAIRIAKATNGLVVIFDEYVDGSGLNYLAIAMDNMGFRRHDPTISIFKPKGAYGPAPYCSSEGDGQRVIRNEFQKHETAGYLRYVMITKDTKNANLSNILEICGSAENMNGEYLRVVMISGRAKEGISFSNMAVFIQYGGVWTPTTEYQAESRGLRTTSHIASHEAMIQRLQASGMNQRELDVAKVKGATDEQLRAFVNPMSKKDAEMWGYVIVDMYKFATIISDKLVGIPRQPNGKRYPSIDVLMYRYAEDKNRQFKHFIRKLKQIAIDCQIHHARNVRPGNADGSAECDYDVCDYQCYSESPHSIDYSTADVYYMKEAISQVSPSIEDYFRKNGSGTLENILTSLGGNVRVRYIESALTDMILHRRPILDRFGYSVYIREDNGIFYITRDFPVEDVISDDQSSSFYGSTYIMTKSENIDKYIETMEVSTIDNVIHELQSIDPTQPDYFTLIDETIKAQTITTQVLILEYVVGRWIEGEHTDFIDTAYKTFKYVVFKLPEPKAAIEAKAEEMQAKSEKTKKRIERINFDQMIKEHKDISLIFESDEPVVYIHSLNSHSKDRADFSDMSKVLKAEGQIRIYKPEYGKWEDTNEYQSEVYNMYIQWQIYERMQAMDRKYAGRIYAVIVGDVFRIRSLLKKEKLKQGKGAQPTGTRGRGRGMAKKAMTGSIRTEVAKDMRGDPTGRKCETIDKIYLIEYLWTVTEDDPEERPGAPELPAKGKWIHVTNDVDEMRKYVEKNIENPKDVEKMSDKKLQRTYMEFVEDDMRETLRKDVGTKVDLDSWDYERILYTYEWYAQSRPTICNVLFPEMIKRKQVLKLR